MKRFKIFGLIATMILTFASCETEVEDPAGLRGVGVVPAISNVNPAVYDSNDLENTFVQFSVGVDDPEVSEAVIVASYKGDKRRTEVARVSSFPATVKLQLKDIATKLGIQLGSVALGDVFNFEVLTVQGDQTYRSNAALNAAVVCAYNPELATGSYRAVSAEWPADGTVTITADPENPYILYVAGLAGLDGVNEDQGPLRLEVNELNYDVTAVKTVLASTAFGYTNFSYAGSGKLNTCDGTFTMFFTITVDQGSFGSYDFTLTKN